MRRFRTLRALASAASLSLTSIAEAQSCTTAVGNLVANCSFEANTIASSWLWVNSLTGWESNGSPNKFEIWRGLDSFAAADGMQHLELDVHHANSNTTIWQTLNTQQGREYTVTFSAAHRNGGGGDQFSVLGLLINDVPLFQTPQMRTPYTWNVFSYTTSSPRALRRSWDSSRLGRRTPTAITSTTSRWLPPSPSRRPQPSRVLASWLSV
jgi:hypothetical protein